MEFKIHHTSGKASSKKVKVADEVFKATPNEHVLYLEVKRNRQAARQGTHQVKGRADVTGSMRKIRPQKGTGRARAGTNKNPLYRGGGVTFGPTPRNHGIKLNRKVSRLARRAALSLKASQDAILVWDKVAVKEPKTKDFFNILKQFDADAKKTLVVVETPDRNLTLSARNIPNVQVVNYKNLSTYDIMKADKLFFVKDAIEQLSETLKPA